MRVKNIQRLRAMIDNTSITEVVDNLSNICFAQAWVIEDYYADTSASTKWRKAGTIISNIVERLDEIKS